MKKNDEVVLVNPGKIYSTYKAMARILESTAWKPHTTNNLKKGSKGVIVNFYNDGICCYVLVYDYVTYIEYIIDSTGIEVITSYNLFGKYNSIW